MMNTRFCSSRGCNSLAEVYAMDNVAGGWADFYCLEHTPLSFIIVDRLIVTGLRYA